jgi:hypothetical protein
VPKTVLAKFSKVVLKSQLKLRHAKIEASDMSMSFIDTCAARQTAASTVFSTGSQLV